MSNKFYLGQVWIHVLLFIARVFVYSYTMYSFLIYLFSLSHEGPKMVHFVDTIDYKNTL